MNQYSGPVRFQTPPAVLNLIIINILFYVAQQVHALQEPINRYLVLWSVDSGLFRPWQLVSYMFLHGSTSHIFFNMFALWMFGRNIEWDMGTRRFLFYYFVTGIGAGITQAFVWWLLGSTDAAVGASGAIYGLLMAFGMMYPNSMIMLLIPPVPMKAKYFVLIFGALELVLGLVGSQGNVAHFAHLGGMLFGFPLMLYWKKSSRIFY